MIKYKGKYEKEVLVCGCESSRQSNKDK